MKILRPKFAGFPEDGRCAIVSRPYCFRDHPLRTLSLMGPGRSGSRGSTALTLLGLVWFFGTLILGYLALYNGMALAGAPARDGELAQVLICAALGLGGGAPVVGLVAAMVLDNKGGYRVSSCPVRSSSVAAGWSPVPISR
ncbi:hypothetical protein [Nonomuraea roseoviolacea]|uniref:MFS transporter n=1 Tax=Nonomuraea roseoviolacea subsp. carminata TaxID=160689 RepID=A0ABT1JX41_9ACTN|nr:hypothetical protein [Nonomuraea roseoviolacea]MCP2346323.1 hypothetical protein [Nonomuraea roseoviolacea subsp. carminata]